MELLPEEKFLTAAHRLATFYSLDESRLRATYENRPDELIKEERYASHMTSASLLAAMGFLISVPFVQTRPLLTAIATVICVPLAVVSYRLSMVKHKRQIERTMDAPSCPQHR